MWEPQPLTTLRASKAFRGENLTFYKYTNNTNITFNRETNNKFLKLRYVWASGHWKFPKDACSEMFFDK
jgi:hypothetical protein